MGLKVLTLWQPWATLYAHGVKKIETRPGPTSYKGTYLIHAAKKWDSLVINTIWKEPFISSLEKLGYVYEDRVDLPTSKIIGAVDIIDCKPIVMAPPHILMDTDVTVKVEYPERAFGNYMFGRYAWLGKNHRVLKEPIPYKGSQGYYADFKGDESKLIFK